MTQEDKELLLKDLCGRLPYSVKVYNTSFAEPQTQTLFGRVADDKFIMKETYKSVGFDGYDFGASRDTHYTGYLEYIKPYLRPMSSMTEKEKRVFDEFMCIDEDAWLEKENGYFNQAKIMSGGIDWLNENHFDYRGLIEKGLALEAPDGMYMED